MLVSFLANFEMENIFLGSLVGQVYFFLFFCFKDSVLDHGTRSIGKKLMKLEIVDKHGNLSGMYRNCFRNSIEFLFISCIFIPQFTGLLFFGACFDMLSGFIFKKRLLDFILGTRVVPESSDHANVRAELFNNW